MHRRARATVVGVTLTTATALTLSMTAASAGPGRGTNNTSEKLREAVTLDGVFRHLEEFQDIADANEGTRAAGTGGYAASSDYVAEQMRDAGYVVEQQEFEFPFFQETAPAELEQLTPDPTVYTVDEDFITMTYSGSGTAQGTVEGVDLALTDPASSTSGCETSDFDSFTSGNIALIQRGACTFGLKAENAEAAGATGVIIFNQGNDPTRMDAVAGTLGGPVVSIPVVGASFALGQDLADPAGTTARLETSTISETRTTTNVIAETRKGNPDNVVMLGAHLDSVLEGPGINDNGSGSAAILEVALQMQKVNPKNKVRFAWWGAEELGLIGSTLYVNQLSEEQREDIALYLNFDMVGSPNYRMGIYDGDGSAFEDAEGNPIDGPEGSGQIEANFEDYFDSQDVPHVPTVFSGRSDYQAFINNGIPSGGLFTGADGVKTEEEEEIFGGVAGAILDPCYHQACDSMTPVADGGDAAIYAELYEENDLMGNIAPYALHNNADAIADAAIGYAYDTSAVNGVESKGNGPSSNNGNAQGKGGPRHAHTGALR